MIWLKKGLRMQKRYYSKMYKKQSENFPIDFTLTKCYDEFVIEKGGDVTAAFRGLLIA